MTQVFLKYIRERLLNGYDDIELTLKKSKIIEFVLLELFEKFLENYENWD